jgi:hypothetical protein
VDFNNGSFALWRLYPLFQISLDGRYEEVYPDQTVLDVSEALAPKTPQAKAAIERLAPTHILFQNPQAWSEIQNSLGSEWREIYRDDSYTLYSRIPNHPTPSNIPGKMETIWDPMF